MVVHTLVNRVLDSRTMWAHKEWFECLLKHGWRTDEDERQRVSVIVEHELLRHTVVVPSYLQAKT